MWKTRFIKEFTKFFIQKKEIFNVEIKHTYLTYIYIYIFYNYYN